MAIVIRDTTAPEFNEVTTMAVAADREYADAFSVYNWEIQHSSLLNIFDIIKKDHGQVNHQSWLCSC
jgi:hypothetical protein